METNKKFHAIDIVKIFMQWFIVSACGFCYWMAMLLVISLILLNVWHVTFETILKISTVLAAITSVIYAGALVKRNL